MKKRVFVAAMTLALLAVALLASRASLTGRVKTLEARELGAARGMMRVAAEVGEDLRRVTGTQTYTAENRTGQPLTELVLRLYPNAINAGSLVLSGITVDGEEAAFSQDRDDPSVLRVKTEWQPGQTHEFAWRFTLTIPAGSGPISRASDAALCVGAFAVPAIWENGAWRTDAYDELAGTLGAAKFDYELALSTPKDMQVALGGALISREETGGHATWTAQGECALDMPFALRDGGAIRQRESCGVLATALASSGSAADKLLAQTARALESLDAIGMGYAGRALCVVEAKTGPEDGLIGSRMIVVDEETDAEQLLRRLTRLIARQMFGVTVQNDPWKAPWLSISLASSLELIAYRHRAGENAYEERFFEQIDIATRLTRPSGVTVGAAVDHFGGDAEMTQVLRDQGAAMLLGIEQAVGEEAYLDALKRCVSYAGDALADRALLEQALLEATGSRWDGYLQDELTW